MSERKENLFIDFQRSSRADWARKAAADLKNEDAYQLYRWQFERDITLDPYYDEYDLTDREKITDFQNRLLKKQTESARQWENIQNIDVKTVSSANTLALDALNNGVDGINFDLTGMADVSFDALLKNILIDYCNLSFASGSNFKHHLTAYCDYLASKEIEPATVKGYFIANKTPLAKNEYLEAFRKTINYPGLKVLCIWSNKTPATEEIADLLLQATTIIEHLTTSFGTEQVIEKIGATIQVSTDYFGEIAKIRALRMLFFQLAKAFGGEDINPEDLHIHCHSLVWPDEKYQPHANMLKSTTAAMAAILGGCDSLQIEPEDPNDPLMVKVARNVSTILKEECYFNKTADPVAGSYYIELLTDKIAQKAWKIFQKKWGQEAGR